MSLNTDHNAWRIPTDQDDTPVPVVMISNSPLLRLGIAEMLSNTRFVVRSRVLDEDMALPYLPETRPFIIIVDASYRPNGTVDVVRMLKGQCPDARIVMLADSFEADDLILQHDIGIDGFCLTTTSRDVLTKALDLALAVMSVFPTPMVLQMLEGFSSRAETESKRKPLDYRAETPVSGGRELSRREAEILRCLMKGLPNKVISRELDVAEATVKVHVKAILRKIGARNRTQAAMWAAGHVLASPKAMAALPAE